MWTPLLRKENVICNFWISFFSQKCSVSKLVTLIWKLSNKLEENLWRKNKVLFRSSEKHIATFLTHKVIIWLLNWPKIYPKYSNYAKLIFYVLNQTIHNFFVKFFELRRGRLKVPHNASAHRPSFFMCRDVSRLNFIVVDRYGRPETTPKNFFVAKINTSFSC